MPDGLLVMAYGTPKNLGDVANYYRNILGHDPSPSMLDGLTARYEAIGGRSPLYEITCAQADGIAARLDDVRVYLGQKFNQPFVADAVRQMASDGITRAKGLVLAPHYSALSIGDYEWRARAAAQEIAWRGRLSMIKNWHTEPGYIDLLASYIRAALPPNPSTVVFTAHSLPSRIVDDGDPYPQQLEETASAVAKAAQLTDWRVAWQSAGGSGESWLGPDILMVLKTLGNEGVRSVLVCPCGFVADHLEVLYDIDIEARNAGAQLGMTVARTRMPNDDPAFLDTLAGIVQRALA